MKWDAVLNPLLARILGPVRSSGRAVRFKPMGRQENNQLAALVAGVFVVLTLVVFDPGGWTVFAPAKWLAVTAGTALVAL
jgi:hypothetical protein